MNLKKCAVLRFSHSLDGIAPAQHYLNGCMIPTVRSHSYLGVIVDRHKFHSHIHSVVYKAGILAQNFLKSTVHETRVNAAPLCSPTGKVWQTSLQGALAHIKNPFQP